MRPQSYPPRRPRSNTGGRWPARALHVACYLSLAVLYFSGHHDAFLVGAYYLALAALVAQTHQ